jgi:hypothetical protein
MRRTILASVALTLLAHNGAHAQTWPADGEWRIVFCGSEPSYDPLRDQPGASNDRDVVGDASQPALYIFADTEFMYFRMRVDASPLGAGFRPFGWGVALDTDGVRSSYELLVEVDGISNPDVVLLGRNSRQGTIDSPADPIEERIATYPASTHARSVVAEGVYASAFGGNPDHFVDWAVPLADLASEGVAFDTEIVLVMGTSSNTQAINADLACHDGQRSVPSLTASSSDALRPDGAPVLDTDGDGLSDDEEIVIGTRPDQRDSDGDGFDDGLEIRFGSDPLDASSIPDQSGVGIRGGPGGWCSVGARDASPWPALTIALAVLWLRRTLGRAVRS